MRENFTSLRELEFQMPGTDSEKKPLTHTLKYPNTFNISPKNIVIFDLFF